MVFLRYDVLWELLAWRKAITTYVIRSCSDVSVRACNITFSEYSQYMWKEGKKTEQGKMLGN